MVIWGWKKPSFTVFECQALTSFIRVYILTVATRADPLDQEGSFFAIRMKPLFMRNYGNVGLLENGDRIWNGDVRKTG